MGKVTLNTIKEAIAFPENSVMYMTLSGLCSCWYNQAKQEGKTEDESISITVDKLGNELISFNS